MNEVVIKSNPRKSLFFVLESFIIFWFCMSNVGNDIAQGKRTIVASELCICGLFLLALLSKTIPCKVILGKNRLRYRTLFRKEITVPYENLLKIQKRQTVMTVGSKWIYLYSKYVLYVKDANEQTVKLKMSSMDEDKFEKVIDQFVNAGLVRYAEKFSDPSWHQKISVPVNQLRKSFSYEGKMAFAKVCAVVLILNILDVIRMSLDGEPCTQEKISGYIATTLILFVVIGIIILFLYRKDFFCKKKVPKEVYLCNTYLQCDDTRYELDNIVDGTFTASQYLGKREIKFKYNDKKVVLRFGKHNKKQEEIFAEYDSIVRYFLAKGFQREILHK